MRTLSLIILSAALLIPSLAFAQGDDAATGATEKLDVEKLHSKTEVEAGFAAWWASLQKQKFGLGLNDELEEINRDMALVEWTYGPDAVEGEAGYRKRGVFKDTRSEEYFLVDVYLGPGPADPEKGGLLFTFLTAEFVSGPHADKAGAAAGKADPKKKGRKPGAADPSKEKVLLK